MKSLEYDREFLPLMERLQFGFTGRVPKNFERSLSLWFEKLSGFRLESLRSAIEAIIESDISKFPSVGNIMEQCRENPARQARVWALRNYEPLPHDCSARAVKIIRSISEAHDKKDRSIPDWDLPSCWLAAVSRYEAIHAECGGNGIMAICPCCGLQHHQNNPLMLKLAQLWPAETQNWNPITKGHLLCDECDRRYYAVVDLKAIRTKLFPRAF